MSKYNGNICSHELISTVFNHGYNKYPSMMEKFDKIFENKPQYEPDLYMILLKDYYKDLYLSI